MKAYPLVDDLLPPILRVAMPSILLKALLGNLRALWPRRAGALVGSVTYLYPSVLKALLGNCLSRRSRLTQLCSKLIWVIPCSPHSRDLRSLRIPVGAVLPIFALSTFG